VLQLLVHKPSGKALQMKHWRAVGQRGGSKSWFDGREVPPRDVRIVIFIPPKAIIQTAEHGQSEEMFCGLESCE
jgi:hypothetical protein